MGAKTSVAESVNFVLWICQPEGCLVYDKFINQKFLASHGLKMWSEKCVVFVVL